MVCLDKSWKLQKHPWQLVPVSYYSATEEVIPNVQAKSPKPQPMPIVPYYIVYY